MLVFSAIVPHPPLSIPGIGSPEHIRLLHNTLSAYEQLRLGLEAANPDVIVVISPHGDMEPYSFLLNSAFDLQGDLSKFSLDKTFSYINDADLVQKIARSAHTNEISTTLRPSQLDHGTLVPLFHLAKNIQPKIVHLSFSLMSLERHFRYGEIIGNIIEKELLLRVAVLASGDLSHKLTTNSPAGFSPGALEFDRNLMRHLAANNIVRLVGMEEGVTEEAAECGLRSITILMGILQGKKYDFDLLSYEHPFGIGYLTARLT